MASGKRAFKGDSAVETMNAILKEEPPEISLSAQASSGLDRIIRHCLEKKPVERFQSARDLAFDLGSLSGATGSGAPIAAGAARNKSLRAAMLAASGVALLATGFWLDRKISGRGLAVPPPVYHRLTYGRGKISGARFSPDGHTIVYSASWEGQPSQLFMKRAESPGSLALALPAANLLAISPQGELAIQLNPLSVAVGVFRGTLAQSPLNGGTPRELLEGVQHADWDGADLVVARSTAGHNAIEWPIGKTV